MQLKLHIEHNVSVPTGCWFIESGKVVPLYSHQHGFFIFLNHKPLDFNTNVYKITFGRAELHITFEEWGTFGWKVISVELPLDPPLNPFVA